MIESQPTTNKCKQCSKRRKDNFMFCTCGNKLWITQSPMTTVGIPGYTAEGYNEGLGCTIKNKRHFDQVCKETGSIPIG